MFIRITLLTISLLLGQAANAAGTIEVLGEVYELEASMLTLPTEVGRSVFVRSCSNCPGQRHEIVASTRYWINEEEVSLATMSEAISANPRAELAVAFSKKDRHLTWVTLKVRDSHGRPSGSHGNSR